MIHIRVRAYDFEDAYTEVCFDGDAEEILRDMLVNILERNEWDVEEVEDDE